MDRKEYNRAVEEYSVRLYRFIYRSVSDGHMAKDLVQDSFLKLWENKEKVPYEKAKSWLFTVGHNLTINYLKKNYRNQFVEEYSPKGLTTPASKKFEQSDLINQCLGSLNQLQKSIILLRDLEGYDYKEIGEILELSESQVKVYLFRARQKVKNIIKDLDNAL